MNFILNAIFYGFEHVFREKFLCIVRTPPPPPPPPFFLKLGGSKFSLTSPMVGGICEIKKRESRYVAGAVRRNRGRLALFLFNFSRFINFTFRDYFTQDQGTKHINTVKQVPVLVISQSVTFKKKVMKLPICCCISLLTCGHFLMSKVSVCQKNLVKINIFH